MSATLGLAPALDAQVTEQVKLLPGDGAAGDSFGAAVATDGSLIAVGAPGADGSGSAYVFDASTGLQLLELVAAGAAAGDRFGASIAVDGGRVVVGAPQADGAGADSGVVHVFDATGGVELLALEASDAAAGARFGSSVALDDGLVAVGALGGAYLFDATTGQQLQQFVPSGGAGGGFGEAVDIDDGLVVVGARTQNGVSGFSGAAYLFEAASGDELERLTADNGTAWAFFGACVSIDGGAVAIGAPEAGPKGKHSGAAYVFDAATGQQEHYLFPADGHVFAKFGSAVTVDGEALFIGSEQNHLGVLANVGSVYRYAASSGSQVAKLVASDAQPNDDFGDAVAAAGGLLVTGARSNDDLGSASGSAYVFDPDSGWVSLGSALVGAHGAPALVGLGSLAPLDPYSLSLTNALEGSSAYLVLGLTRIDVPFKGGTLVPAPTFVLALPTGPAGAIAFQASWPAGLPSGFTVYLQYWIVDPVGPLGLSASNAVAGTQP